jgi:chromosome segregation ATPase
MNRNEMFAERSLAEDVFRRHKPENGVAVESGEGLALAPLVDKIAYGIAKGLVVAMKELENHIANETRKVGDGVGQRLDSLQSSLTAGLATLRSEAAETTSSLRETDARQAAELESLRAATMATSDSLAARIDALGNDLTIQKEDIAAIKSTLSGFTSNLEAFGERLDRQADALRTICAAYSQRETELGSLMDGLARLRAYPAPAPMERL